MSLVGIIAWIIFGGLAGFIASALTRTEQGPVADVFSKPQHPYTLGLLRSAPDAEVVRESLVPIPGSPPSLITPPSGCRFHPRCSFAEPDCAVDPSPPLRLLDGGRATACLHYERCQETFQPEEVSS